MVKAPQIYSPVITRFVPYLSAAMTAEFRALRAAEADRINVQFMYAGYVLAILSGKLVSEAKAGTDKVTYRVWDAAGVQAVCDALGDGVTFRVVS